MDNALYSKSYASATYLKPRSIVIDCITIWRDYASRTFIAANGDNIPWGSGSTSDSDTKTGSRTYGAQSVTTAASSTRMHKLKGTKTASHLDSSSDITEPTLGLRLNKLKKLLPSICQCPSPYVVPWSSSYDQRRAAVEESYSNYIHCFCYHVLYVNENLAIAFAMTSVSLRIEQSRRRE